MIDNPEFRRLIQLEMTPYRMVGMPLILGAIFYIAYLIDDSRFAQFVASTAVFLFVALTFLWGNRQATESVITEIRDRTWDWQRMSSIDPWSLAWGKLFGSTIYTWYGGLICLMVYFAASNDPVPFTSRMIAILVLGAVFCQASGLFASLQLLVIKERSYNRSFSTATIFLALILLPTAIPLVIHKSSVVWYQTSYNKTDFIIGSLFIFDAWFLAGIYRLVMEEFRFKMLPAAWPSFVLFMMIYAAGFPDEPVRGGDLFSFRILSAFITACGLAYLALLTGRKDPVAYRRMIEYAKARRWRDLAGKTPSWAIAFLIASGAAGLLMIFPGGLWAVRNPLAGRVFSLSIVAFLWRDMALCNFFNLGKKPYRADMLLVLWLFILYGIAPGIFLLLKMDIVTALFWPRTDYPFISFVAAAFHAAVVLRMTIARWKRNNAKAIK